MTATVELRPLTAADAALIAALGAESFPPGPDGAWTEAGVAALLRPPFSLAWLARIASGGAPAGFIIARRAADEAEILSLAVRPPWRRRGIATALVAAALAGAAAGGARRLFLEVSAANAAARACYAALGFAPCGRRARYYADGGDAVLMRRDLPA